MWFTTLSIPSWGPSRDLFNLPSPWETTSWSAWTTSEERTIAHHHSRWPVVPSTVRKSSLSSTYAVTSYGEIGSQTTGCLAISVKSETPLFSDIYRCSRLSFYVVIGHCAGFDFLKKKLKFFFGSWSGPSTSPAWFSGSAWF